MAMKLTEICNSGIVRFDLIGDTKNGGDFNEGRGHDLTVECRLPEVTGGLRST